MRMKIGGGMRFFHRVFAKLIAFSNWVFEFLLDGKWVREDEEEGEEQGNDKFLVVFVNGFHRRRVLPVRVCLLRAYIVCYIRM